MSQNLTLPEGHYVRFTHYRFYTNLAGEPVTMAHYKRGETKWNGYGPYPRGGATVATIYNSDGDVVATGKADCSLSDAFCYKLGMAISKGRALKKLYILLQPKPQSLQGTGSMARNWTYGKSVAPQYGKV